jgi:hypothetical protein
MISTRESASLYPRQTVARRGLSQCISTKCDRAKINAASAASHLAVVFLWSLRRGFVSRLDCILLGHVFPRPRRAVKTRAFPVVNACLGVNPHLAVASAGRGCVGRFLGRAPCGYWACTRTRLPLRLRFLGSRFCFGRKLLATQQVRAMQLSQPVRAMRWAILLTAAALVLRLGLIGPS